VLQEAIMCHNKIDTFTVSKDKWITKEDAGMSMKSALCVLWYAKRHLFGWSNIKQQKIKPVALAIIEVRLT